MNIETYFCQFLVFCLGPSKINLIPPVVVLLAIPWQFFCYVVFTLQLRPTQNVGNGKLQFLLCNNVKYSKPYRGDRLKVRWCLNFR